MYIETPGISYIIPPGVINMKIAKNIQGKLMICTARAHALAVYILTIHD